MFEKKWETSIRVIFDIQTEKSLVTMTGDGVNQMVMFQTSLRTVLGFTQGQSTTRFNGMMGSVVAKAYLFVNTIYK